MERICFLLKIRAAKLAEYKQRHARIWPEMIDALRQAGWHNYSLFLREDGLLVGYLETPSFSQALLKMKEQPINEQWQRDMMPFFESIDSGLADDNMLRLEEVFHLD
jgi:L-rhamnose mutarotase